MMHTTGVIPRCTTASTIWSSLSRYRYLPRVGSIARHATSNRMTPSPSWASMSSWWTAVPTSCHMRWPLIPNTGSSSTGDGGGVAGDGDGEPGDGEPGDGDGDPGAADGGAVGSGELPGGRAEDAVGEGASAAPTAPAPWGSTGSAANSWSPPTQPPTTAATASTSTRPGTTPPRPVRACASRRPESLIAHILRRGHAAARCRSVAPSGGWIARGGGGRPPPPRTSAAGGSCARPPGPWLGGPRARLAPPPRP